MTTHQQTLYFSIRHLINITHHLEDKVFLWARELYEWSIAVDFV